METNNTTRYAGLNEHCTLQESVHMKIGTLQGAITFEGRVIVVWCQLSDSDE